MYKKCCRCEVKKPVSDFYRLTRSSDGYDYKCKLCSNKSHFEWLEKNRDKHNQYQRNYVDSNRKMIQDKNKKYYHENQKDCKKYIEQRKVRSRAVYQKYKDEINLKAKIERQLLTDRAVRHMLAKNTCLSQKDIPQELVDLKRVQMLIHREVIK